MALSDAAVMIPLSALSIIVGLFVTHGIMSVKRPWNA